MGKSPVLLTYETVVRLVGLVARFQSQEASFARVTEETNMRLVVLVSAFLAVVPNSDAKTFPESNKMCIYEIATPQGRGTGFALSDTVLKHVIITCKHVLQDSNGNYYDSVFLRRNKLLQTGEAISDTSRFVLRLNVRGSFYVAEHPNPSVDLVMIPVRRYNTNLSTSESLPAFYSRVVLSKQRFEKKGINEGTDVELIGFYASLPRDEPHYHFSRFGKIGLYTTDEFSLMISGEPRTANFMLLDMTTRPGDSGAPVFAHIKGEIYLIGFLAGGSAPNEYAVAYPVYYLYHLMERMREKLRGNEPE